MAEPTISAGYARALMALAVSKGADQAALSEQSEIGSDDLLDQDNRIPLAKYVALMRAGKALSHDPALALHFGEAFDIEELSIVGLIGQACETLAEAFTQLNRYGRLVADVDVDVDGEATADRLVLTRESGQLWLIDKRKNPNAFPELTESSFARMVCRSRRGGGETSFVKAVHVTHAAPAYRAEYDRIFQMPVVFESDKNALLTDEGWLALKAPIPSRYVFGVFSERAEALLKRLEGSKSTRCHVERLLMPILHTGDIRMDLVASKMGLGRQTLLRRLKTEGVTFESVLDDLRRRLALDYLSGQKVSVNETAYLVGFSEPAAFSRAFKRWTGSRPGKHRPI